MEAMLDLPVEDRLNQIFDMIERGPLQVSQMLTTKDLETDRLDTDGKNQLMTYIGAIRSAHKTWWEDYLKKQQDDSDASKKALNDGDQYWKQGLHKFSQAREKCEPVITDIRTAIREDVKNDPDPVYEEYTTLALRQFDDRMPEYDEANDNFNKASDEYKKVTHKPMDQKIADCEEKVTEVEEHRRANKKWLEDLLQMDYEHNRAWRLYLEACDDMDETIMTGVDFINTLVETTVEKLKDTHTKEGMDDLHRDAMRQAMDWIVIFDPLKEKFMKAHDMYPDSSVDGKRECLDKIDYIDNTISEFLETVNLQVADAFHDDFELSAEDMLQLYHDTTVAIDKLTNDDAKDVNLYEIIDSPTNTKDRLDEILKRVQGVWGDSDNLRQKVHDRVDAIFNAHGYKRCDAECEA